MFKYRGQLNNKTIVDIIDFKDGFADCDKVEKIHIDEFNTIFIPAQDFKKDILKIESKKKEVKVEEVEKKIIPRG